MENKNRYQISFVIVFTCILLIFFGCATSSNKKTEDYFQKLQGKWEGADSKNKVGSFIFYEDGRVDIILDGKSFSEEITKGIGRLIYSLDSSISPMKLDIICEDNNGNELGTVMKMIVQFLPDDKIKIRTLFSDKRPEKFLEEDDANTIILSKVK